MGKCAMKASPQSLVLAPPSAREREGRSKLHEMSRGLPRWSQSRNYKTKSLRVGIAMNRAREKAASIGAGN